MNQLGVTRGSMRDLAVVIAWVALLLAGAGGWFLTSMRLASRWGPEEAAPAVGAVAALAVATLIWRWARRDAAVRLDEACPRCGGPLQVQHEHARSGALAEGLTGWRCDACDYERYAALTCEACEP